VKRKKKMNNRQNNKSSGLSFFFLLFGQNAPFHLNETMSFRLLWFYFKHFAKVQFDPPSFIFFSIAALIDPKLLILYLKKLQHQPRISGPFSL
jgi:hypothetical protein